MMIQYSRNSLKILKKSCAIFFDCTGKPKRAWCARENPAKLLMKKYTAKVTFSMTERHFKALEQSAKGTDKTPHQIAREIVESRIDRNEDALKDALNLLAQTVTRMGEDLAEQIEQLAEGQMEQGRELSKLKESMRRDLEKVAAAITGRK